MRPCGKDRSKGRKEQNKKRENERVSSNKKSKSLESCIKFDIKVMDKGKISE